MVLFSICKFIRNHKTVFPCLLCVSEKKQLDQIWVLQYNMVSNLSLKCKQSTSHFCQRRKVKSTLCQCQACSSKPHAFVEEAGSQSSALPAQEGRSCFVACWWRSERCHRPASQPRSGPALQTSRQSKAGPLWRSLPRTPDRSAVPPAESSCVRAADRRLYLGKSVRKSLR